MSVSGANSGLETYQASYCLDRFEPHGSRAHCSPRYSLFALRHSHPHS